MCENTFFEVLFKMAIASLTFFGIVGLVSHIVIKYTEKEK
jgi:putative effector of murein hydrolase LrgA (UPF0299 family)